MTGLEAFAFTAGILQVVGFAHQAGSALHKIYTDGSEDPGLLETANQMRIAAENLERSAKKAFEPLNKDEAELLKIAEKCIAIAGELSGLLEKLVNKTPNKIKRTLKTPLVGVRTWWNKGKIDQLEKDLRRIRDAMQTQLLIRV